MSEQLDLFEAKRLPPDEIRRLPRYGRADARCDLPLRNDYSTKLSATDFAIYKAAFRSERALQYSGA